VPRAHRHHGTSRRVYRRNRDGAPDCILAAITLDIDDITTA